MELNVFIPDEVNQYKVIQSIISYKSGDLKSAKELIFPYINQLKLLGMNKFIMGCTELPIILNELSISAPDDFIDATEELIKETVNWYNLTELAISDDNENNKMSLIV